MILINDIHSRNCENHDDHDDNDYDNFDNDDNDDNDDNYVTGVLPMGNWAGGACLTLWSLEIQVIIFFFLFVGTPLTQ